MYDSYRCRQILKEIYDSRRPCPGVLKKNHRGWVVESSNTRFPLVVDAYSRQMPQEGDEGRSVSGFVIKRICENRFFINDIF